MITPREAFTETYFHTLKCAARGGVTQDGWLARWERDGATRVVKEDGSFVIPIRHSGPVASRTSITSTSAHLWHAESTCPNNDVEIPLRLAAYIALPRTMTYEEEERIARSDGEGAPW